MNRIICDICGSEYPETDDRCPICNYPRQGNEKLVASAAAEALPSKVKGGRFNSKNVKKRNKDREKAAKPQSGENPNKPLLVVIALLLCAIVLVSAYIGLRFFRGRDSLTGILPMQTTAPTETTAAPEIPCTGIVLDAAVVELEELGEQAQIVVTLLPLDTTDAVSFQSEDPAVASVSETGVITAVGPGQTRITVTCGEQVQNCTVVCWYQEPTTVPTEPVEVPTEPLLPGELTLSKTDVTCTRMKETFDLTLKAGESTVSGSQVSWSTSDPDVATVQEGSVTAVGKGTATITASYNGKQVSCIVRCALESSDWTASATDVTLNVGLSFRLTVTNEAGETADAVWTMSTDGIVSVSGSTVTGRAAGTVTLTTTVDGETLSCIVRVQEP